MALIERRLEPTNPKPYKFHWCTPFCPLKCTQFNTPRPIHIQKHYYEHGVGPLPLLVLHCGESEFLWMCWRCQRKGTLRTYQLWTVTRWRRSTRAGGVIVCRRQWRFTASMIHPKQCVLKRTQSTRTYKVKVLCDECDDVFGIFNKVTTQVYVLYKFYFLYYLNRHF